MHILRLPAAFLLTLAVAGALTRTLSLAQSWTAGPVLFTPGPPGSFDEIAVKDPTIVRHENRWHLFYTARNRTEYTLGYVSAEKLEGLNQAKRHPLSQLHSAESTYAAAPQVFYFRPHLQWYLIFQNKDSNYQPVYSTAATLDEPDAWTPARPLLEKKDTANWIDFWIICDSRQAYLFFTRDHREVMVMTTALTDFPAGFANPKPAFSPVHESVHVYSVAGPRPSYVMLYEQQENDRRRFGLARAPSLNGPWTLASDTFATASQLSYPPGQTVWTNEVSHGEILRSSFDELLQIPARRWQFLIQGLPQSEHRGDYALLPWRLGLITAKQ